MRNVLLAVGGSGTLALLLAFAWAAATRRLNFDESLALRAGWLLVEGIPASPDFYMPLTWALGHLAHQVDDPGLVFLTARIVVAVAVLASLVWAVSTARESFPVACGAVALTLIQVAFAVHGYEFRYDAALLVGWMVGFGLVVRGRPGDLVLLGLLSGWLGAHHVKGAIFAAGLLGCSLLRVILDRREVRRRVSGLGAGLAAGVATWVGLSFVTGLGGELTGVWRTFVQVGSEASRVPAWTALSSSLARDALWWILGVVAVAWTVHRLRGAAPRDLAGDWRFWAIGFAAWPWVVIVAHPHPWQYMLAVPAPFLALLMARFLAETAAGTSLRGVLVAAALVLGVYAAGVVEWPGTAYVTAARAPSTRQVQTLRALRFAASEEDRVLDPSGLAYAHPPCLSEWYIDTLFAERARRGRWMTGLERALGPGCDWVVHTSRIDMLPEPARTTLQREYTVVGGAVGLRTPRVGADSGRELAGLPWGTLRSFW